MPPLAFLARCCVDTPTQHIACDMVNSTMTNCPKACRLLIAYVERLANGAKGLLTSEATASTLSGGKSRGKRKRGESQDYSGSDRGSRSVSKSASSAIVRIEEEVPSIDAVEVPSLLADIVGIHLTFAKLGGEDVECTTFEESSMLLFGLEALLVALAKEETELCHQPAGAAVRIRTSGFTPALWWQLSYDLDDVLLIRRELIMVQTVL